MSWPGHSAMGRSGQFVPGPLLCGVQVTQISAQTSPVAAGSPQHPKQGQGQEQGQAGLCRIWEVPNEVAARTDPLF